MAKNVRGTPWIFTESGQAEGYGSKDNYNVYATIESSTHGSDLVTVTAHGFVTGNGPVRLTGSDLPAGLSTDTDYWIIKASDDTIKFATSRANALAGTQVATTDDGSGTQKIVIKNSMEGKVYIRYIVYDVGDSDTDGTFSVLNQSGGDHIAPEWNFVAASDELPVPVPVWGYVRGIYINSIPADARILVYHGKV